MPKFIASYDLKETYPDPHSPFLQKAEAAGWALWILSGNQKWYRLPNTTLVGEFADKDTAVNALKQARSDTQQEIGTTVTMPKWIVAEYSTATFISDDTT
jgi:preprotein translocase subunit Sec63